MPSRDCQHSWATIVEAAIHALAESDDERLWKAGIAEVFRDAEFLCTHATSKSPIFAQVGSCSHWQRPHQHRWLKDGSFAAPYGYGGTGFNIHAVPEFDWALCFAWTATDRRWNAVETICGKRPLTLRVTLPTRTSVHNQAAIHTVWTPGSPTTPRKKVTRLYGFRKTRDYWECTATAGDESPYECMPGSD